MNRGLILLLSFVVSALCIEHAHAQTELRLNHFRQAPLADDGFGVDSARVPEHKRFGFHFTLDYAHDPLVVERDFGSTDSEFASLVEHQLNAQIGGSVGLFDRLAIFAGLQVGLMQTGEEVLGYPSADGTALSDFWLGARVRLVGDHDDVFALAAQLTITVPLGTLAQDVSFSGEAGWHLQPELIVGIRPGSGVRIALNVGAHVRQGSTLRNLDVSHELSFGLGIAVPVYKRNVWIHGELFGSTGFNDFGSRDQTPIEAILGAKYRTDSGWNFGLAGGAGLQRGYGAPDVRVIGSFGLGSPNRRGDLDGDGIYDDEDECINDPEDFDNFEDEDGCPEADNDQDGILDADDSCPLEPEDMDGFEDEDGCPDPDKEEENPDRDGDGILNDVDQCPDDPEDMDEFEDEDGCPDNDNDVDTVLDVDDRCPLVKGTPKNQGCPEDTDVEVRADAIVTLENIEFALGRARIRTKSRRVLKQISNAIKENKQITHLIIEGHTSNEGSPGFNMKLSKQRSRAVIRWLLRDGVDKSRFASRGCGEHKPILPSDPENERNRRVEFLIRKDFSKIDREGCQTIDVEAMTQDP